MAYWLDWAVHKPLSINYTPLPRARTDGIILHVAASNAASLYGWFSNPTARASSHLYVRFDGTVEQYIDLDCVSWASVAGDARCISVETAGQADGQWTDAQQASLARIIAETSAHYGYPLRLMSSSKASERGVGWHALGVPATRTQNAAGISQTGGERWSGAVGKVCPGPARVRQIPSIVSRAGRGSLTESEEMTPQQEEKLNHLYQVCDHILEALDPIAKNAWLAAARSQANTAALEALAANSGDVNVAGKIEAAVNRALADVELGLHVKKENKQ